MADDKYKNLLLLAKQGNISEADVAQVAGELQKANPEIRRYTLLHIIGRSFATRYRKLVESYLEYPEDPQMSELALQILCDFWGNTADYLEYISKFMHGVDWDTSGDCRDMAVGIAGEYLRDHDDPDFLKELVDLYENEGEDHILREGAYRALARAIGKNYQEIPSAAREFDLLKDIDPLVVKAAKERLANNR